MHAARLEYREHRDWVGGRDERAEHERGEQPERVAKAKLARAKAQQANDDRRERSADEGEECGRPKVAQCGRGVDVDRRAAKKGSPWWSRRYIQ